ncbi:MAG TPA: hypothetical protein VJU84_16665 [Pyrinomonadaceae bacterium]|nr:hypothetical protein [Pyrinomonadaceae bacterium]
MSNVLHDNSDGVIEAEVATLPEPQRAPPESPSLSEAIQQPALSEEELQKRQDAIGERRRPAGPPLESASRSAVDDNPSDVPETDVTPADTETE